MKEDKKLKIVSIKYPNSTTVSKSQKPKDNTAKMSTNSS